MGEAEQDSTANLVKVLRRKCDSLEDQLDEEETARDEAVLVQGRLEAELADYQLRLRQLEEVKLGRGASVIEQLQTEFERAQARTKETREEIEETRGANAATENKISEELASQKERADDMAHLENYLMLLEAKADETNGRLTKANAEISEWRSQEAERDQRLTEALASASASESRLEQVQEAKRNLQDKFTGVTEEITFLEEQEESASQNADAKAESLQTAIDDQEAGISELRSQLVEKTERRKTWHDNLSMATASHEKLKEKLASIREELDLTSTIFSDMQQRVVDVESDFLAAADDPKQLSEQAQELTIDRDCAVERMQAAEWEKASLLPKFEELQAHMQTRREAVEIEVRQLLAPVEESAAAARERRAGLDERLAELRVSNKDLQAEAHLANISLETLTGEIAQAQNVTESCASRDGNNEARTCETAERLQKITTEVAELNPLLEAERVGLDTLGGKLDEAQNFLAEQRKSVNLLSMELKEEQAVADDEESRLAEFVKDTSNAEAAISQQRENAEMFLRELEAERGARDVANSAGECEALQRKVEMLVEECSDERMQADQLHVELERDRAVWAQERNGQSEWEGRCEELRVQVARVNSDLSNYESALGHETSLRAAERSKLEQLESAVKTAREQLQIVDEERGEADAEFKAVSSEFEKQRRLADDLQGKFDAVQPEHMDLFARYSVVIEQIDVIKGERQRLTRDVEQLRVWISQAQGEETETVKLTKAVESAPPRQLAVSDVLISIQVEGCSTPLHIRPWDANFGEVVKQWLFDEQQSSLFESCLVDFLQRLEGSAESFPVETTLASLQDLHEQFKT